MYPICFDESIVYTEINMTHTSRSIEILTKLKVVILTSIVLLFSTQVGVKAEPRTYYGINYYSYTERTDEQDPFMELKTNIPTVIFGLRDETAIRSNNSSDKFSYMVEGTLGNVTYSQYTGTGSHTHNYWTIQTEGLYALPSSFYAGVGYRYLKDYLSAGGYGGYDRQNMLLYIPAGYARNNYKIQYNFLLEGTQFSELSQIPGYGDLTNEQNDGFGLELSYTFLDPGSDTSGWEIFTKYWNIEDSTTNTSSGSKWIITGMEPLNETYEIGVKALF
jgi:hypothetical protein